MLPKIPVEESGQILRVSKGLDTESRKKFWKDIQIAYAPLGDGERQKQIAINEMKTTLSTAEAAVRHEERTLRGADETSVNDGALNSIEQKLDAFPRP